MLYKITIQCIKQELSKVRQFTFDLLKNHKVSEINSYKLVLAIDEVCTNIIVHSNKCNPKGKIELIVEFNDEKIIFTFKDKGKLFNINDYQAPPLKEIISSRRKGGLGLILVKNIIDKIEFSIEKNHNICKLIKII